MAGDIREFVESYPIYQLEKTNRTLRKGSFLSLTLPEVKCQEVSIDFVMDSPAIRDLEDSIIIVVDPGTKMVHLILYRKTTTVGEATQLY